MAEYKIRIIETLEKEVIVSALESQSRKELFEKNPFKILYVHSKRRSCAKRGDFEKYPSSAIAYGWYIWEKGFHGEPIIKWI